MSEQFPAIEIGGAPPLGTGSFEAMGDVFDGYDVGGNVARSRFGFSAKRVDGGPKYRMRAKHIPTGDFVQWFSFDWPDTTGVKSGIPPEELSDVVIIRTQGVA